MADLYNDVVETVQGPYQTVFPTFANRTGQIAGFNEYALIVAATGAGLVVLGWLTGAWSSGAVSEGAGLT